MTAFAYDLTLMRPGCVILQAALGGNVYTANRFPTESWLLAPTPRLKLYKIPDAELDAVIELAWLQVQKKVPFKEAR